MDGGKVDFFILISLAAAVVAILKLYSILGRDSGGETRRSERQQADRRRTAAGDNKVVTMPRRDAAPNVDPAGELAVVDAEQRIRSYAAGDQAVIQGLLDVF